MCRIARYVHYKCWHKASSPFVYQICEAKCYLQEPALFSPSDKLTASEVLKIPGISCDPIFLSTWCHDCAKIRGEEFNPFDTDYELRFKHESDWVDGLNWHIRERSCNDPGFQRHVWKSKSGTRSTSLDSDGYEVGACSPRNTDGLCRSRRRKSESSISSGGSCGKKAELPLPLGKAKPRFLSPLQQCVTQTDEHEHMATYNKPSKLSTRVKPPSALAPPSLSLSSERRENIGTTRITRTGRLKSIDGPSVLVPPPLQPKPKIARETNHVTGVQSTLMATHSPDISPRTKLPSSDNSVPPPPNTPSLYHSLIDHTATKQRSRLREQYGRKRSNQSPQFPGRSVCSKPVQVPAERSQHTIAVDDQSGDSIFPQERRNAVVAYHNVYPSPTHPAPKPRTVPSSSKRKTSLKLKQLPKPRHAPAEKRAPSLRRSSLTIPPLFSKGKNDDFESLPSKASLSHTVCKTEAVKPPKYDQGKIVQTKRRKTALELLADAKDHITGCLLCHFVIMVVLCYIFTHVP